MWLPFIKSSIPVIKEVSYEDDGNTVKIIHTKGAVKFAKSDVLHKEWKSDVFSPALKNFSMYNAFLFLILTGGFVNLFRVILPPLDYKWYIDYVFNFNFLGSIFLGFISSRLILVLYKMERIRHFSDSYSKNVLILYLNNSNILIRKDPETSLKIQRNMDVRSGSVDSFYENFRGEIDALKVKPDLEKEKDLFDAFFNAFFKTFFNGDRFTIFYLATSILLYCLFYYVPFWFYNIPIAEGILSGFLPNDLLQYNDYFPHNESNTFIAFLHGAVSVFITPLVIISSLFVVFVIMVIAIGGFIGGYLILYTFYTPLIWTYYFFKPKMGNLLSFTKKNKWVELIWAFVLGAVFIFINWLFFYYFQPYSLLPMKKIVFWNIDVFALLLPSIGLIAWGLYFLYKSRIKKLNEAEPDIQKKSNLFRINMRIKEGRSDSENGGFLIAAVTFCVIMAILSR